LAVVIGSIAAIVLWKRHKENPSPAEAVASKTDALFAQWNRSDSPACSLGISKGGVSVYERGYRMASLELSVPITPASVFPAASISKQFTAMSILLLVKRGRLSLWNASNGGSPGNTPNSTRGVSV
jgi:CubicO group peptidase (beta-lactamase class C family)